MEAEQEPRKHWQSLPVDEQAFVVAYVENAYSTAAASEAIGITSASGRQMLAKFEVKKAIAEVQEELDSISFLNDRWIKAKVLDLFPKVMGEEDVNLMDNMGNQILRKKFFPDVAVSLIKLVGEMNKAANNDEDGPAPASVEIIIKDARREDNSDGE